MSEGKRLTEMTVTAMLVYDVSLLQTLIAEGHIEYERNKIMLTIKNGQRFEITTREVPTSASGMEQL
jgi:hypothetical protein